MSKFNVGDKVWITKPKYGPKYKVGTELVVGAVKGYGVMAGLPGNNGVLHNSRGLLYFESDKVAAVKPKTKTQTQSTEITLEEVQEGDLIVAFWNSHGVEYRQKGVVAEVDRENMWATDEGNYITHKLNSAGILWKPADHIYLLERKQVAPKGFAALDKSKVYRLAEKRGGEGYFLKHDGGLWVYSTDYNSTVWASAENYEVWFTDGKDSWEKPVEYTPTYAEKHNLDPKKAYIITWESLWMVLRFMGGEWCYGANDRGFLRVQDGQFVEWSDPVEYKPEPKVEDGLYGFVGVTGGPVYRVNKGEIALSFPDSQNWGASTHNLESFSKDIENGFIKKLG